MILITVVCTIRRPFLRSFEVILLHKQRCLDYFHRSTKVKQNRNSRFRSAGLGHSIDDFTLDLKLANFEFFLCRFSLLRNKKLQVMEKTKKELALSMQSGKLDQVSFPRGLIAAFFFEGILVPSIIRLKQARVRVEHYIREESTVNGYEMLGCLCDLLIARFSLVESEKTLPSELKVSNPTATCDGAHVRKHYFKISIILFDMLTCFFRSFRKFTPLVSPSFAEGKHCSARQLFAG